MFHTNCPLTPHLTRHFTHLLTRLNLSTQTENTIINIVFSIIVFCILCFCLYYIYQAVDWIRGWVGLVERLGETNDERRAREGEERWLFEDGRQRWYESEDRGISGNSNLEGEKAEGKEHSTGEEKGMRGERIISEGESAGGENTTGKEQTKGILRNATPREEERSREWKSVRFDEGMKGSGVYFKENRTNQEWWLLEARGEKRTLFGGLKSLEWGFGFEEAEVEEKWY